MNQMTAGKFDPFPGISEQVYSRADFEQIRDIVYNVAGICMAPEKATLIYSRIAPLVRNTNSQTFARYISMIRDNPAELRKAINALTTNHTFFYRERHHFDHLASVVRPYLRANAAAGRPVRIWSAGCSTGEELYSLVLTLLGPDRHDARPFLEGNVAILATDLADHAVAGAKSANYPTEALKDVPPELVRLWTTEKDGMTQVKDEVRKLVRIRRLNLLGDWPMRNQFDIIFCRNVMIYFDQPTKDKLVTRFIHQLVPDGFLYIGHSERVCGPAEHQMSLVGNTIYRKAAA